MHENSKIPFVREVNRLNKILRKKKPKGTLFQELSQHQIKKDISEFNKFEKYACSTGYHSFNRPKFHNQNARKREFSVDQKDYEHIFSHVENNKENKIRKNFAIRIKPVKTLTVKKENVDLFKSLEKFEKFLRTDAKIKKNNSGYPRIKLNVFLKQINK